jgi:MFS family permease
MGRDLREMLVSPPALLAMALISSPIGVCAAGNIWPAIAPQWGATPDAVALFTGLLSGFVSAAGCVCGGWIADRTGPWQAFFGTGVFSAAVAFAMAGAPRTLTVYCAGVLVYALSNGLAWAAYSALVLHAIGRGAASTKYAALSSLGNLPLAYMTALNGWVHDRSGAEAMLVTEAGLGIVCVLLGLWALGKIRTSSPAHDTAAAGRET